MPRVETRGSKNEEEIAVYHFKVAEDDIAFKLAIF